MNNTNNKNNITLYRYSKDGFISHYQHHHVEGLEIGLKNFNENNLNYPMHLLDSIKKSYADVLPEWKEFTSGVFTFVGSLPDNETIRILLNHLNHYNSESCWWTAEISEEQFCFEIDNQRLWKKEGFSKIKNIIEKGGYEIYIPQQFLKVENIQQWSNDYRSIYHQPTSSNDSFNILSNKNNKF